MASDEWLVLSRIIRCADASRRFLLVYWLTTKKILVLLDGDNQRSNIVPGGFIVLGMGCVAKGEGARQPAAAVYFLAFTKLFVVHNLLRV